MIRRTLAATSLTVIAAACIGPGVSGATSHSKIGPHQHFVGLVNRSLGSPTPTTINVICPGPATLGQRGHPLSGQTVAVGLTIPATSNPGYTGDRATTIAVFFGPPPPTSVGPGQVTFTRYGVPKAIPTSLNLPCEGTGVVTFVPFPQSPPTSRSASVTVRYANVAATPLG